MLEAGVVDFNLDRLGPLEFEHLTQALCITEFGARSCSFGDGPDGGREATITGLLAWDRRGEATEVWNGYTVVQAKFRGRQEGVALNFQWLREEIRKELARWTEDRYARSRTRRPDNLLIVTNVRLSATAGGGIDRINQEISRLVETHCPGLLWRLWHYDDLRALLTAHSGVRHAFPALITPGDVLARFAGEAPSPTVSDSEIIQETQQHRGIAVSLLARNCDSGVDAVPADPVGLSNLPSRNPHFTGRIDKLTQLEDILGQKPVAIVAMHGLGGIGKTQLAQEYAHRNRQKYRIAWWIPAASQSDVSAALVQLGEALGFERDRGRQHILSQVRSELATNEDWLLVFDNAADARVIREFLPAGNGHILITSRARNWTGLAQTCGVQEMEPEEAHELLSASTGRGDLEIPDLARELGYLPLALAQAAGYIATHDCTVARYVELYLAAKARLLAAGPPPHGYPDTVATTWLLHFEALSPPALALLQISAFLAPDAIPVGTLLDAAHKVSLPTSLRESACDPVSREAVTGELVGTSLLTRTDDRTVRVHRLVQEVTRDRMTKRDIAIYSHHAVQLVLDATPTEAETVEKSDIFQMLSPHARVVAMNIAPTQKAARPACILLMRLGLYLYSRGEFQGAICAFERALSLVQFVDPTRREESKIRLALGILSAEIRDYERSAKEIMNSIRIAEGIYGNQYPQLIPLLVNLSRSYVSLGREAEAVDCLKRAGQILKANPPLRGDEAASLLSLIAKGSEIVGDHAQVQRLLEEVLVFRTEQGGPGEADVSATIYRLAHTHYMRGDRAAAFARLDQAIKICTEWFGDHHPHTRRMLDTKARWHADINTSHTSI